MQNENKNSEDIQIYLKSRRRKKLLTVAAVFAIVFLLLGFLYWHLKPTEQEKEIADLIDQLRGSPPTWLEKKMKAVGLSWFVEERPKPDFHPNDMQSIAMVLAKIGPPAVPELLRNLDDENYIVRSWVILTLGVIGDERAVSPIIEKLNSDPSIYVRESAARVLGQLGGDQATDALILALSQQCNEVKTDVVRGLGSTGEKRAIKPLVEIALKNKSSDVRCHVAGALAKIGGREVVEPLIKVITSGNHGSGVAVKALGKIGDKRAVEPLIKMLNGEQHPVIREDTADALGKIGDIRAIKPLISEMRGIRRPIANIFDLGVRFSIAQALRKFGPAVTEPLLEVLQDDDPEIRRMVIGILWGVGDVRAIGPLVKIFENDKDEDVREAAAGALAEIHKRCASSPSTP